MKPLFLCEWFGKDIIFIEQIYVYRKKQFYSFNEIKNLYKVPQTDF